MSKYTKICALLCVLVSASSGFADQKKLDADREVKIQAVFESLKRSDAKAFASDLAGLSQKEALTTLQRLSTHWGDLTKLATTEEKSASELDKGKMETIVHLGAGATNVGKWLDLRSPEAPGRWLRIGILFPKRSSEALQFLAVEWKDERKQAVKGARGSSDIDDSHQAEQDGARQPDEPIERPKAGATVTEKVEFYIDRLSDATYGEKMQPSDGHPSFWHTAPEALGLIGSPAIKPLIKRVEISQNATELTWAFYALMLASQAQDIKAAIGPIKPNNCGGYIYPKNHPGLKNLWLNWWKKYGSNIQGLAAKPLPKPQAEQDGADQPATAPDSKSEGKEKPESESGVRSR